MTRCEHCSPEIGYIIEERMTGIDQWFRANGYVYKDDLAAIGYADSRSRAKGIAETRVLEIYHTEPEVIETFPTKKEVPYG